MQNVGPGQYLIAVDRSVVVPVCTEHSETAHVTSPRDESRGQRMSEYLKAMIAGVGDDDEMLI